MKRGFAGLLLIGTFGCATMQDSFARTQISITHPIDEARTLAEKHRDDIPQLSPDEYAVLHELSGDAFKLQDWIDSSLVYTKDETQFYPSICDKKEDCDYWAPVAHVLRSHREDCDGIIGLAHYVMEKKGFGLFLSSDSEHIDSAHIVYVYPKDGKYGIISVNAREFSQPRFDSLEEVALFVDINMGGKYNLYKKVKLPAHDAILLYEKRGIEPYSHFEDKAHFFKKKT